MGSANIQAKIKKGLSRAVNKTGSANSDKVYLIKKETTQGDPISPGVTTVSEIELVNAVFLEYSAGQFNESILKGDRKLVCNNDVKIKQGDIIRQDGLEYYVINTGISAPTSDILVYMPQLRLR